MRTEALEMGFVPHANALSDSGLPWEETYGNFESDDPSEDEDAPSNDNLVSVPYGNNLVKNLTPLEHVFLSVEKSKAPRELEIPEDLLVNITYLFNILPEPTDCSGTFTRRNLQWNGKEHAQEVDQFRGSVIANWDAQKRRLHNASVAWAANAPRRIASAVQHWNGPLIDYLISESGHVDQSLVYDLQHGFPVIGDIPAYGVSSRPKVKVEQRDVVQRTVWAQRQLNNSKLLGLLTEDTNSDEIMRAVNVEVEYNAMTAPTIVTDVNDLRHCVASRRFMVAQVKEKQGKLVDTFRHIDHLTESVINPTTYVSETLENDNLNLFFNIIRLLMSNRIKFNMFKEDIARAFRRLPIKSEHLKFMVVLFIHNGITWQAQHLTCPFGAKGSVTAWHRVSPFPKRVMTNCTGSVIARYVDDFFGIDLPD